MQLIIHKNDTRKEIILNQYEVGLYLIDTLGAVPHIKESPTGYIFTAPNMEVHWHFDEHDSMPDQTLLHDAIKRYLDLPIHNRQSADLTMLTRLVYNKPKPPRRQQQQIAA